MASTAKEGEVVILEDPAKLRKLARLLWYQEEALMTEFTSEDERIKYLQHCNASYDGVIELIQKSEDLVCTNKEGEQGKDKIVEDIRHYIKTGINSSMQNIRNCSLRAECVSKINLHVTDLVEATGKLEVNDLAGTQRLAEEVSLYKEYMWEYTNTCRSAKARVSSKIYSSIIKQDGLKFPDLVERHKNTLKLEGEFEELAAAEKLKVYNSIIEESGRAKIPKMELLSGSYGVAVLVAAAALIAFDIYEAEYKLEAIVREAFSVAQQIGTFAVQVAVDGAVTAALVEFELGVFVVAASAFTAGLVAGILFMAASGSIIDLIFGSGGKVEQHQIGMKFHKLDPPDGMALANLLAHEDY